jgi:Glycosyl transferase family 11
VKPTILIAERAGQLGNRLFHFGHFVAFAHEHRFRVVHLCFGEYAELFEGTRRDLLCRYPPGGRLRAGRLRHALSRTAERGTAIALKYRAPLLASRVVRLDWRTDELCELDERFAGLVRDRGLLVTQGWLFRNESLFAKHADAVRDFLRPIPRVSAAGAATVARARARGPAEVVVGIHIRRGDYDAWRGGAFLYSLPEYVDVMRRVVEALSPQSVSFVVCSNEPLERASFGELSVVVAHGSPAEDMFTLAACDRIAGPPSTFSMWASFFGRVPLYVIESPGRELSAGAFRIAESEAWFRARA